MWKQNLSEYFSFTKKERTGVMVIIFFIVFFTVLPFFYPMIIQEKKLNSTAFEQQIAALKIKQEDSSKRFSNFNNYDENNYQNYYQPSERGYKNNNFATATLFYFDPNTATAADWQRLGLREKSIQTIQNYISKGGHFYKPEDLRKIWGLRPEETERLIPYIQITAKQKSFPSPKYEPINYDNTKFSPTTIDINESDTTAFIALPGIGSKLANRIINYRNKLGGFHSIDQIGETYGLKDSVFQKIKSRFVMNHSGIKKINLNTCTLEELRQHPYIKYQVANAIIQYRNQHGSFSSIEDLKKIIIITDEVFKKAAPYLTVE